MLGLITVLSLASLLQPAFAQLEVDGTSSDIWILDTDDDTPIDQVILQFGTALEKHLRYDIGSNIFIFNESLEIEGDLTPSGVLDMSGGSFINSKLSSDPSTCVVGEQFYNTTSNKLKVCTATNTWSTVDSTTDVNTLYINRNTSNGSYITIGEFIYSGTSVEGAITAFYATAHIDTGASYDLRVYDSTNALVIAEVTGLSNNTQAVQNLGTVSNLPSGQAIFQIQAKRVGGLINLIRMGSFQYRH